MGVGIDAAPRDNHLEEATGVRARDGWSLPVSFDLCLQVDDDEPVVQLSVSGLQPLLQMWLHRRLLKL